MINNPDGTEKVNVDGVLHDIGNKVNTYTTDLEDTLNKVETTAYRVMELEQKVAQLMSGKPTWGLIVLYVGFVSYLIARIIWG